MAEVINGKTFYGVMFKRILSEDIEILRDLDMRPKTVDTVTAIRNNAVGQLRAELEEVDFRISDNTEVPVSWQEFIVLDPKQTPFIFGDSYTIQGVVAFEGTAQELAFILQERAYNQGNVSGFFYVWP